MTTYYLVKYILIGNGRIVKFTTDEPPSDSGHVRDGAGPWHIHKIGRDAFTTPEAAIAAAEAEREKLISGLRKQIAALEKLEFFVEGGAA